MISQPALGLTAATAILSLLPISSAQIIGCADVGCPTNPGRTSASCTLVDKTFNVVGVAEIPTDSDALAGLSWVQGVEAETSDGKRTFEKSFYLGAKPGLDLTDTGACALFFSKVSDRVKFGDEDPEVSKGTCQQALSEGCVNAILNRAKKVNVDGLSVGDACEALQKDFEQNVDSECGSFATTGRWSGLEATGT